MLRTSLSRSRWLVVLALVQVAALSAGCDAEHPASVAPQGSGGLEPVSALGSSDENGPVIPERELFITDLRIIEHPTVTRYVVDDKNTMDGDWSFGRLMERLSGTNAPSRVTMQWLRSWELDQTVNGFVTPARPAIRSLVIDPWMAASGCAPGTEDTCTLDFARAPFRLLAIVYRPDLRKVTATHVKAGEGRFVFGVLGPQGEPLKFTVIFEYELPASTDTDVLEWAGYFHSLGAYAFDATYVKKLWGYTNIFLKADAMAEAGWPNGSALSQLRTNELALDPTGTFLWELREFRLSRATGMLAPVSVKQTPDFSLNGTSALADWVNANAAAVQAGTHAVPESLMGHGAPTPFRTPWSLPGVDEATRQAFAVNTCSGCHHTATGTLFLHVGVRQPGVPTVLSSFVTNEDLPKRAADLQNLLTMKRLAATSLTSTLPASPTSAARVH